MLSETVRQAEVRLSSTKRDVGWLFDVVDKNSNEYHWSTKEYTIATPTVGQKYAFKIIDFDGYEVSVDNATSGIITPNEIQFTILNKDVALYSADFVGGTVTISLRCSDTVGQETIRGCKFRIKKTIPLYGGGFKVVAEDFLQKYLKGSYPNSPYPDDLFPNANVDQDDGICVPVTFGTAYVPLKPVYVENGLPVTGITISFVASANNSDAYIKDSARGFTYMSKRRFVTITGSSVATNNGMFEVLSSTPGTLAVDYDSGIETQSAGDNIIAAQSQQFYILGAATATFTTTSLRSPRELGRISTWSAATYDHVQTVITDRYGDTWNGLQVRETDGSEVLFKQGDMFIAAPLKFSRQYTASMTAFQDVIEFILKDFGLDASEINSSTFTTAGATRASLSWGGGIYYKEPRETVLAKLLNQCHCGILPGASGVELRAISATSVATITSFDIINPSGDVGEGSFVFEDSQLEQVSDCGHMAWQPEGESTDQLLKLLVSAYGSLRSQVDSEVLELPFVHDSKCAQRLGKLYYQRKLMKSGRISFLGKSHLLHLDPNDVITIAANVNYTSSSTTNLIVVIDSIKYNKDLSVQISGTTYSCALDSWSSLAPTPITVPSDIAVINCFQPSISGPLSTEEIGRAAYDMWGKEYLKVGAGKNVGEYQDIQKAFNAVARAGGGAILLINGTYPPFAAMVPDVNIEIVGQTKGGVILQTAESQRMFTFHNLTKTFKFSNFTIDSQSTGDFYSAMFYIYGDTTPQNTADIFLEDIDMALNDTLDGGGSGDVALYTSKGTGRVEVNRIKVVGGGYGLFGDNDSIKVCNSIFDGQTYGSIWIGITGGELSELIDCKVLNQTRYAVMMDFGTGQTYGARIKGNKITARADANLSNSGFYCLLTYGSNVLIEENECVVENMLSDKGVFGIVAGGTSLVNNNRVINNLIRFVINSAQTIHGLSLTTTKDSKILHNTILIDNSSMMSGDYPPRTRRGISLTSTGATCSNIQISSNTIDMFLNMFGETEYVADKGVYVSAEHTGCYGSGNDIIRAGGGHIDDNGPSNTINHFSSGEAT